MWERNIYWLPLARTPTGDQTCNPGMRPDQEPNGQPFGLQNDPQPTEPHQSRLSSVFFLSFLVKWLFKLNLGIVGIQSYIGCMSFRCTIQWFDILIFYSVIDHPTNLSNHLSLCKLITILVTIFPFPLLPLLPPRSLPVTVFCFCFYFVHLFCFVLFCVLDPTLSETIWYLSFYAWLTSLSI